MQRGKRYTEVQKIEIIERIADGLMDGLSLRKICDGKTIPPKTTILRWLSDSSNQALVTTIARARELQCDAKFDQMDEIMAEVKAGTLDPQSARVIIWGLQWQLSKLQPRKYGERLLQELKVENMRPVETITMHTTPEEAARIYRQLIEH